MLKNKKAVYILIPLNLLIWGFFIYRFYTSYYESNTSEPSVKLQATKVESIRDSIVYTLSLDYKDPFLKENGRSIQNTYAENNSKPAELKKVAPPPPPVIPPKQLPDLKYLGLIKNTNTGMTTALVSVNGQSRMIKANESMDGIVFKSFNKDSLVAKWGKERIVARK
jgi:hypothetical protein